MLSTVYVNERLDTICCRKSDYALPRRHAVAELRVGLCSRRRSFAPGGLFNLGIGVSYTYCSFFMIVFGGSIGVRLSLVTCYAQLEDQQVWWKGALPRYPRESGISKMKELYI